MRVPLFFLSCGLFGERGFKRVSFWQWLIYQREHVNRVKWFKCGRKGEERK
jgi:hypothetical protein